MKNSSASKFISCPFCGYNKIKITSMTKKGTKDKYYQGICNKCYARGPKTHSEEDAIMLWNRREYLCNKTKFKMDREQLDDLLNSRVAVNVQSQTEMNTLLQCTEDNVTNASLDTFWHVYNKYGTDTALAVHPGYNDNTKLILEFSSCEFLSSEGFDVQRIKMIKT